MEDYTRVQVTGKRKEGVAEMAFFACYTVAVFLAGLLVGKCL